MKVDLSIILTCYNKEPFLEECFQSIREQTVKPKEIILIHDGCNEPTTHIDATTIVYSNNMGVVKARAEGVRFSRGELLLFVDGDDKLAPNYIEFMTRVMPKTDIAYPDMFWWFTKGGESQYVEAAYKLTAKNMLRSCKIPVTSMMHRQVFEKLGGFRPYPMYEDWDFWLRAMVEGYKFTKVDTFLWYRQDPHSRNRQNKELRQEVYKKISSQYQIKRGKLCLKD